MDNLLLTKNLSNLQNLPFLFNLAMGFNESINIFKKRITAQVQLLQNKITDPKLDPFFQCHFFTYF